MEDLELEKVFLLLNTAKEKKYLSIEELKKQRKVNFTEITKENVKLVPRHNLAAIEYNAKNEVNISRKRLRKETTPRGLKPYTNDELKKFLKTLGLKVTGKKEDLITRIEDKLDEIEGVDMTDDQVEYE